MLTLSNLDDCDDHCCCIPEDRRFKFHPCTSWLCLCVSLLVIKRVGSALTEHMSALEDSSFPWLLVCSCDLFNGDVCPAVLRQSDVSSAAGISFSPSGCAKAARVTTFCPTDSAALTQPSRCCFQGEGGASLANPGIVSEREVNALTFPRCQMVMRKRRRKKMMLAGHLQRVNTRLRMSAQLLDVCTLS